VSVEWKARKHGGNIELYIHAARITVYVVFERDAVNARYKRKPTPVCNRSTTYSPILLAPMGHHLDIASHLAEEVHDAGKHHQ
jgi:hypothetical protein